MTSVSPRGKVGGSPPERVKIRGLARISSALFALWGAVVAPKGLYDLFWGEPEANLYAPSPWAFVSREAWLRYGGFELVYGLSCAAVAWALWRYARFLPDVVERTRE